MTLIIERTMLDRTGLILAMAAAWIGLSQLAMADDPPAKQGAAKQGAAKQGAGKQAAAKPSDAKPNDANQGNRAQREKVRQDLIARNEAWRNTLAGLDQWLSVQTMYSKSEMDEIRARVTARLENMSSGELEEYRQDLDARLTMLLGPEGRDILGWVAANLAAAAPAYRKKMDIQYPDVARLTAAQLREQLDLLEQKRSNAQARTAATERARQARIAGLQAQERQEFQAREQALNRGAGSASNPYRPGNVRQYPNVVSTPQFGWGFGFW